MTDTPDETHAKNLSAALCLARADWPLPEIAVLDLERIEHKISTEPSSVGRLYMVKLWARTLMRADGTIP